MSWVSRAKRQKMAFSEKQKKQHSDSGVTRMPPSGRSRYRVSTAIQLAPEETSFMLLNDATHILATKARLQKTRVVFQREFSCQNCKYYGPSAMAASRALV